MREVDVYCRHHKRWIQNGRIKFHGHWYADPSLEEYGNTEILVMECVNEYSAYECLYPWGTAFGRRGKRGWQKGKRICILWDTDGIDKSV
jgi:hypothetical protein